MDRKEFLAQLGMGTAGLVLFGCLGGCEKETVPAAPTNVNLTLDLTSTAYSKLLTPGQFAYTNNGIIVAQTKAGDYIAVSQACTHQGVTVEYLANSNDFFCTAHGSKFSATGAVVAGPAGSPLKQYTVTKSGNTLTITG